MKRNLFVLPDGTEIFSGVGVIPTIQYVTYTASVNNETNLDYCSACAAMIEATLIDTSGVFSLAAGDEITVYDVDDAGGRSLLGIFILEAPEKPSANTYKLTAYDRMIKFDKDLSVWLTELDGWPYSMRDFLNLVCDACGVELDASVELLNADFPVMKFIQQVTGRQLIKWIAGANASFALITPEGKLTFEIFTDGGALDLPLRTLRVCDYATAPVERVVIKQTEDDIGVSWPEDMEGETYTILANPLLAAFSQGDLLSYAERLAGRLIGLSYTPAEAQVYTADTDVRPGVFLTLTDQYGKAYKTAVFTSKRRGGITTISSTGNATRSGSSAQAGKDPFVVIQGRIVEIAADLEQISLGLQETVIDVDGVKTQNSALSLRVDEISSEVKVAENTALGVAERLTRVEQKAEGLEISVNEKANRATVEEITEHFIFDENGLTITNSGTGMGIGISEKRVEFTGGSSASTVIKPDEMTTTNLRVGSRLDLGKFSFFPRTNGNLSFRYTGGASE